MTSWMPAAMGHHAASLSETLSAKVAHVRSFSRMSQPMYPKRVRSSERPVADFALVRSFASMLPHV